MHNNSIRRNCSNKGNRKKKNKEEETKTKAENKIGEVVKVGDVEYIVNSKSLSQNVGGEFGKNANGIYLILNVTVKNNGKKSITVTDDFFKLLKMIQSTQLIVQLVSMQIRKQNSFVRIKP